MTFKAVLGLRVLVEAFSEEMVEQKGDILLVENKAMRPKTGKIFSIGGGVKKYLQENEEQPLEIGDTVMYEKTDYPQIKVEKEDYDLIQVGNIIAVV